MTLTVTLRDIGSTYGGLSGKTKTDFGCGDAFYVTFLEVINNTRLRGRHLERVRVAKGEQQNRIMRGDLLFNGSSETPEELALSSIVEFNPEVSTFLNSFCFGFRLRPDAPVEAAYLAYFFRSSAGRSLIASLAQGATRYNIAKTKFLDIELALPTVERQRAIVQSLSDVESLIAGLQRMIAKKQAIRQGMMQQLLTGKTRLPGFTAKWMPVRLGDVGNTYGGLVGKNKDDFGTGSASFVTFMEVMAGARLLGSKLERVKVGHAENQNQVFRGDVLFNGSSETPEEVALAAVVDYDPSPRTYLNSFCFGYRLKVRNQIDPTYLAYLFRSAPGREIVASLAQGATRYNIARTKLMQVAPVLPPIAEQWAIVEALNSSEAELDTLLLLLEKARAIKTGMMQELFTSRTRLPVKEVAA